MIKGWFGSAPGSLAHVNPLLKAFAVALDCAATRAGDSAP